MLHLSCLVLENKADDCDGINLWDTCSSIPVSLLVCIGMYIYKIRVKTYPRKTQQWRTHICPHQRSHCTLLKSLSSWPPWASFQGDSVPAPVQRLQRSYLKEMCEKLGRRRKYSTTARSSVLGICHAGENLSRAQCACHCSRHLHFSTVSQSAHRATEGECPLPLSLDLGWAEKSVFDELLAYTSQWKSIMDSRTLWRRDRGLLCPCMQKREINSP